MPIRAVLLRLLPILLAALALATPASAGSLRVGSLAWTNSEQIVRQGPGPAYQVIGRVAGEQQVKVLRCLRTFCLLELNGGNGWVKSSHLNFGTEPGYPLDALFDNQIHAIVGGAGQVCFWTGANYTGESYCVESGAHSPDLVLQNLDNKVASISIEGRHYVEVCTGLELSSYCDRLTHSYPTLDRFLHRSISSFWVH